jgi:hypothetical protein
MRALSILLFLAVAGAAQNPCPDTLVFSTCDITFELDAAESAAHPDPWRTVQISAEVKSPRFRTFIAQAFWDGGRKLVLRVTPTDDGLWELKLSSNIARFDKLNLSFKGLPGELPGFLERANVHHWRYTGSRQPHLWLGAEVWDFRSAAEESFATIKAQGATHIRTLLEPAWPPDPARFAAFEKRVQSLNADGIVVDIVLAGPGGALLRALPDWNTRERYFRYLLSRLAPLNVTWEIVKDWETYPQARGLLKDLGALIQKLDPYSHPRSAYPLSSTSAFIKDGWMTHLLVNGEDPAIPAIEHQLHGLPLVSIGKRQSLRTLYSATFAGAYPGYGATRALASLLGKTRYWDLQPYFDVSNGRCLALIGTEYLVYVDRPGIVEVEVEKHGYDAAWVDAATGERTPLKEFKGEHFIAETPSKDREWILHLSREGRKEGMLKSYKFESTPVFLQEVEVDPKRVPFSTTLNDNANLKAGSPVSLSLTITRDTRATRFMQYLVTADVPTEMQGMQVFSTNGQTPVVFPAALAARLPAVLSIRILAMNSNGKLYSLDRIVRLEP